MNKCKCECLYVCVHVCACMFVHVCVFVRENMHVCLCVCVSLNARIHVVYALVSNFEGVGGLGRYIQ